MSREAKTTYDGGRGPARFARALASPVGVIITVPLLVVACGLGVLLLGRGATRTATEQMARHQLVATSNGDAERSSRSRSIKPTRC